MARFHRANALPPRKRKRLATTRWRQPRPKASHDIYESPYAGTCRVTSVGVLEHGETPPRPGRK